MGASRYLALAVNVKFPDRNSGLLSFHLKMISSRLAYIAGVTTGTRAEIAGEPTTALWRVKAAGSSTWRA
jgi:hypothetical protein